MSALATLLVGGAAFAGIADQRTCVKICMLLAATLWLLATFLYAQAATGTFSISNSKGKAREVTSDEAAPAAKGIIALVHTERDLVRWKTRHANAVAFLAATTSVIAIGLIWILDPATQSRATIKINSPDGSKIAAICKTAKNGEFSATIDLASLSKKFITLTDIKTKDCKNASELTIPTKWVEIVAVQP